MRLAQSTGHGRRAALLVVAGLPMAAPVGLVHVGLVATLAPSALAQGPLSDPFPAVLELADLDGAIGFRLEGTDADDHSGRSVASAGDVNGDGIDDLIIGAVLADPGGRTNAGSSCVVFGRDMVSCRAELDGDGALTIFDFLMFQNEFDAGCE